VADADVIVVGAGIIGAACAYFLTQAGARVVIVDPTAPGTVCTAACMGHLVVMDDSEAQFALTAYSCRLWTDLAARLPRPAEYEPRGTLWVASTREEMAIAEAKSAFYRARGVEAHVVTQGEMAALEPALDSSLPGGLWVPGDSVLYATNAARWLLDQSGTTVLREEVVAMGGGRATLDDGRDLEASVIVNAAGAAAPALTTGLPIEPRKGHLAITDRYPGVLTRQTLELGYLASAHGQATESVAFNIQPRATGQMLIGSSREFVGFAPGVNRAIVGKMLERAQRFVPCARDWHVIRIWTGFRPCTPDNLPLIGPAPGDATVWIAAGHEGLGITTSLATGRLLADRWAARDSAIDPVPFAVDRVAAGAHG